MSEPFARSRLLGEPRNAFDLEEIERRMRQSIDSAGVQQPPQPQSQQEQDPLAELARLVGQANDDALSRIFTEASGPTMSPPTSRRNEPPPLSMPPRDPLYAAAFEPEAPRQDPLSAYAQPAYGQDLPYGFEPQSAPHSYGYPEPAHYADAGQGYDSLQGYDAQQGYDPHHGHDSLQGHDPHAYHQQDAWLAQPHDGYDGYESSPEEQPRRTGRAKLLIGAAILVVAGGATGAYMLRGSGGPGRDAPTIMANPGPTKVQPAEPASDGPKQSISILERGGASGNAQGRVVQNEEQPVDVSATARASGSRPARAPDAGAPVTLAPPPPPPVANSLFAEPKRVKAIAVRPDGTIIDAPGQAATPRAEAPATPAPPPVPAPRPTDMASLVASTTPSSTTPGSGAKPPVRPEPRPAEAKPAPKPAAPAAAASIPSPAGAGGAFSVQLAGTTSIEEAKDAVERLTRKYASELGAYRPAVVKADVGSKTVYRVRVKNLSSDDANTLCAKLKSSGGSCFVARD